MVQPQLAVWLDSKHALEMHCDLFFMSKRVAHFGELRSPQRFAPTGHQNGRASRNLRTCLPSLRSSSAKPRSCHPSTIPAARATVASDRRRSANSSLATRTSFCVAQIVLQRLQEFDELQYLAAIEQVPENLDRVAQFLDGYAKLVTLLPRELNKRVSCLFNLLITTPDQGRRHRIDRRHQQRRVFRDRLIPPAARGEPLQQLQQRFRVLGRPDRSVGSFMRGSALARGDTAQFVELVSP